MKSFLIALLFFTPTILLAQGNGKSTSEGNKNPTTPTPFANPYGANSSKKNFYDEVNKLEEKNKQNSKNKEEELNSGFGDKNGKNKKDNTTEEKKDNTTEDKDLKDLKDKNLTPEQLQDEQLKELYKNDPDYLKYLEEAKEDKQQDNLADVKVAVDKRLVFGQDFFINNVFNLSANNQTTPPSDYRIGIGDQLIVQIWGNAELQEPYVVARDGAIFPNKVGKIYIQGMAFDAARRLIISKFRKIIPANNTIEVQMGAIRTIKVNIIGEVRKSGTFTIPAFNTALNALQIAGGLTSIGNMRDIEVIRRGVVIDHIDLYQYLLKGATTNETYLEDNDYLNVKIYERLVSADGAFKRPMYYQLTGSEGVKDLIELAGGPLYNARNSLLRIKTTNNELEEMIELDGKKYLDPNNDDDFVLKDGDVAIINYINTGVTNTVTIDGSVYYPDSYEIRDGQRLLDVIKKAGGLKTDAYLPRAFIYRGGGTMESEALKINLNEIDENSEDNITILSSDKIRILSSTMFNESYNVSIIGLVRNPGNFSYTKNMRLKDLLLLSGGLKLEAENGRIEISSIVDSIDKFNIKPQKNTIKIITININLELDKVSENILLKPLDRVYIRRKVDYLSQDLVQIIGEVAYPGEYSLFNRNEKLSSIVKRAGGVLPSSFTEGSKLIRTNIGAVVIDMEAALSKNGSKEDIVLRSGDVIIVPSSNDIVSVRGQVQQAINIKFDKSNNNINHYISAAGGFNERPWKKRINVRYQNGRLRKTKNILFFKFYPKIQPGSTVTVPYKPDRIKDNSLSGNLNNILTALTSLATIAVLAKTLR
jgi:protein involved in polysaccharide export with SLBB domain